MKKVLVTGAAGFIASRVTLQLLDQGVEVVAVDNFNDAYDARLKQHRMTWFDDVEGLTFIEGDISDASLVNSFFERHDFDVVFNLAARAGVRYSLENPDVYFSTNVDGTRHLLQAMRFKAARLLPHQSTR